MRKPPRTAPQKLRAAALKIVRVAAAEVVKLVGHDDPIASRLADILGAESARRADEAGREELKAVR
jgi:hypothetical protein